jgi:protein involved in temperature-dependent protein secretion
MHSNDQVQLKSKPKSIKSWNANYILYMDETTWEQACVRITELDSSLTQSQSNYRMQVACMNLIESKHASKWSNSIQI